MCGDATNPDALDALLGQERPTLLWTDPPYGVDYVGKTADALKITNDQPGGLGDLLTAAWAQASRVLLEGAAFYVCHPAGPLSVLFAQSVLDAGWGLRQTLVWDKGTMVLGHADYHYAHEPILYGYLPGAPGRRGRGGQGWFGDHSQTTVFAVPKPARSQTHPTMKPVELVAACITNSTPPGGLVLDLFAGSGSTLIACHGTDRVARLVEIDPAYVDVTCRRWQEHTGDLPVLEATGQAHDFTQPKET